VVLVTAPSEMVLSFTESFVLVVDLTITKNTLTGNDVGKLVDFVLLSHVPKKVTPQV
jgi:hypothetical protein